MTHAEKFKSILAKKQTAQDKYDKLLNSNKKLSALDKEIDSYLDELDKLSETCPHENHIAEYGSNTGNYDLYESYCVDVKCHDCGERMTFYSEKHPNEYRRNWKAKKL